MPIFTLREKSMPSTNSRKPCTKCWRDCSPSLTMSMPASSCALSHRSVASRLASSSARPSARQVGQSFFGAASQEGFGRLPARVVFSIGSLRDGDEMMISLYNFDHKPFVQGGSSGRWGDGRDVLCLSSGHLQSCGREQGGAGLDVGRRSRRSHAQPLLPAKRRLPALW